MAGGRPGTAPVVLLPPAVLKPHARWTGKQVISSVLMALTGTRPGAGSSSSSSSSSGSSGLWMDGKSKIGDGLWGRAYGAKDSMPLPGLGESALTIRGSQLLTGVIDKNSLGNTSGGLTHAVYEAYGPAAAGALLSATGRLLTVWLQWASSTCGMDDLNLTPAADASRAKLLEGGKDSGALAGAGYILGSKAAAEALLLATSSSSAPSTSSAATSAVEDGERRKDKSSSKGKKGSSSSSSASSGEDPSSSPVLLRPSASPSWNRAMRHATKARMRGGAAAGDTTGAAATLVATELDNAVKGAMADVHSKVIDACLPHGLGKTFPSNQFSLMVASGA